MDATASKDIERQDQLSERTAREHAAVVRAVETLERALASPAPGRERAWKERARRELAAVVGFLQEHCESAESTEGVLVEVERQIGRSYELTEATREHGRLQREATNLLASLDEYGGAPDLSYQEVRHRAAALISDLRAHEAREADLLMQAFQRDIGIGD